MLTTEREKEEKRFLESTDASPVSCSMLTHPTELMLTAFAIEALLKALWLRKGNKLVEGGHYKRMPCERKRFHNLGALCHDTSVDLTDDEKYVLGILSDTGRFHGRYSIARRATEMHNGFLWSWQYDKVTGELVTRLWRSLGHSLKTVPIGGLPLSCPAPKS